MYSFQMMQRWFGRFSKHSRNIQVQMGLLTVRESIYSENIVTTAIPQSEILSFGCAKRRVPKVEMIPWVRVF